MLLSIQKYGNYTGGKKNVMTTWLNLHSDYFKFDSLSESFVKGFFKSFYFSSLKLLMKGKIP